VSTLVRKFDKRAPPVAPVPIVAGEDESALISAAKTGDAQAFEVLIARHQRKILAVAMRCIGVRQDAEDKTPNGNGSNALSPGIARRFTGSNRKSESTELVGIPYCRQDL
jgi:hypothetical protein